MGMGTICHIRPVDKDQNVSLGDAEQTWPPAEGLAEMAGVIEFAVRNYELGLRAPRPQHPEALARALGVDPALEPFAILSIGYPLKPAQQQDRYDPARVHFVR